MLLGPENPIAFKFAEDSSKPSSPSCPFHNKVSFSGCTPLMLFQFHVFFRTSDRAGFLKCRQTKRSEASVPPLSGHHTSFHEIYGPRNSLGSNTTVLAKNELLKTCRGWKKSKNSHERLGGCQRVKQDLRELKQMRCGPACIALQRHSTAPAQDQWCNGRKLQETASVFS